MFLYIIDDAMIYAYALSLLFYFSNCTSRNRGAKRMGTGLLACALLILLVGAIVQVWEEGAVALFSPYGYFELVNLSLIIVSLALSFRQKSDYVILLINMIGLIVMIMNRMVFLDEISHLHLEHSVRGLLLLHVILAGVSFAALSLAAVFAVMYLFLHQRLKRKKWSDILRRLPSLESLDRFILIAMIWGISLLAVSLVVAGAIIVSEGRWVALADLKVAVTFVALVVYLLYFLGRHNKRYSGVLMAKWALLGYAIVILNFVVNSWSTFHSWVWR